MRLVAVVDITLDARTWDSTAKPEGARRASSSRFCRQEFRRGAHGGEVPAHGSRRLPVQLLLSVVLNAAAEHLSCEEQEKHRQQRQCQPAVANPLHTHLAYRT